MAESENSQKEALPFELYVQRRNRLEQIMHDQARSFDKGILTLSTGALGLSLLFIEKVAPHPAKWSLLLLAGSWLAFVVAVISTLLSFLTSQRAHEQLIEEWDETWCKQADSEDSRPDRYGLWTRRLNRVSVTSFACAVFLLMFFAFTNLFLVVDVPDSSHLQNASATQRIPNNAPKQAIGKPGTPNSEPAKDPGRESESLASEFAQPDQIDAAYP